MDVFAELNEKQREAVGLEGGPLLILAGAGSGKTKTLTHRIANLIANRGVRPGEILAVTFTNKAAKEMRGRLWGLLETNSEPQNTFPETRSARNIIPAGHSGQVFTVSGKGFEDSSSGPHFSFMPFMGTFHGICVKILRMEADAAGIDRNFVIYDEDDRVSLIKRAMKDLGMSDKQVKPKSVSGVISKEKNDFVSVEEYEGRARYPFEKAVAKVFKVYERERKKAGALDFDDLLLEAVGLFKENKEVRERWRARFRHILVDEYQDTNAVQYQLVKLLVNEERNVCVVGDDWQSIYSWRGADFTNILNFERDFGGATVIKLEQNYRSTKQILDAAHRVISQNKQRTEKELWTEKTDGENVEVVALGDETEEAYFVGQGIGRGVSEGRRYSDFAVLYRTNAQSYAFERIFMQMNVPYKLVGGVRFYDRKEIKDVMAYLKLLVQPSDIVSFNRIVNVPARGVGEVSVGRFLEYYRASGGDLVEALLGAEASEVTGRAKKKLVELGLLLRDLQIQMSEGVASATVVENLLKRLRYREFLSDGSAQGEDRVENLGVLVTEVSAYAELTDFLADAALMSSSDDEVEGDRVTLMTLHAAKGLEFPVVYLVGMEEGVLPHSRAVFDKEEDIEEERRLAYVGMTRAREELRMSWVRSRYTFGQKRFGVMSRFLVEALGEDAGAFEGEPTSSPSTRGVRSEFGRPAAPPPTFDSDIVYDVPGFEVGDRVRSAFGEGEIVDVDGLAVTVKLRDGKTKKLNVEYARLERL